MDTTETFHDELEKCLGSINSDGLEKLDPQNIEKLEKISAVAAEHGMNQGKKLIDNLVQVLKNLLEGKSTPDSVSLRLTALDFYINNIKGSSTEEL
ncbi:MAG: hypothetical protein FWG99_09050 [Treponema sp.]|nr:hypothetical protein [Treponema sp.]